MRSFKCYFILIVISVIIISDCFALTAVFIPKSFYVIHNNGEKSPVINFREKRSLQEPLLPLIPVIRSKRDTEYFNYATGFGNFNNEFFNNLIAELQAAANQHGGFPEGFSGQSGNIVIPSGDNSVSSGGYPVPSGGYSIPSGGYSVPSGGYPVNSGGYSVPSGGYSESSRSSTPFGTKTTFTTNSGGPNARAAGTISYLGSSQDAKVEGVYTISTSTTDENGNVHHSTQSGKI